MRSGKKKSKPVKERGVSGGVRVVEQEWVYAGLKL